MNAYLPNPIQAFPSPPARLRGKRFTAYSLGSFLVLLVLALLAMRALASLGPRLPWASEISAIDVLYVNVQGRRHEGGTFVPDERWDELVAEASLGAAPDSEKRKRLWESADAQFSIVLEESNLFVLVFPYQRDDAVVILRDGGTGRQTHAVMKSREKVLLYLRDACSQRGQTR